MHAHAPGPSFTPDLSFFISASTLMFKSFFTTHLLRTTMAVLAAIALHASPAAAALTTVGELPVTGVPHISVHSHAGMFSDDFVFSLGGIADLSASLASLELAQGPLSIFNIDDLQFSLYSLAGGVPAALLASGSNELNQASLVGGDYLIRVSGIGNGLSGGQYLFGLAAAAVPEPEQWMLFGAALLAMGCVTRRRMR